MSIDFNLLLTTEEKQSVLVQKIKSYAADAYTITLNKQVLESSENVNQDGIDAINNDLETLERAINVYKQELDSLTKTE